MKSFRNALSFLVYSNIFIAGCAMLMVMQTYRLVLKVEPPPDYLLFVVASTLCSYSFHWFLTFTSQIPSERLAWNEKYRYLHVFLFITGLISAAFFFFQLSEHWPWLLLTAFVTFLYSAPKIPHPIFRMLRKVALGKTIFLAMVWTAVTTILPVIMQDKTATMDQYLFCIGRFFYLYAICILFDFRDRQDDRAAGIKSLITYFDEKGIYRIFLFSLAVFYVTTMLLYNYEYSIPSISVLLLPGILLLVIYRFAIRYFNDLFYYFVLDGLMAFSAIFTATGWILR